MIEILQALLTPVIAVLTTVIAYQQYRLRRDENSLIMYDRRLKVYNQVVSVIHRVRAFQPMSTQDALDWIHSLTEARFLFGDEVEELIAEIYSSVLKWADLTEPYKIREQQIEFSVNEWSLECSKVIDEIESFAYPIKEIFSPYLYPEGAPFWKGRKSLNRVLITQKKRQIDEESRSKLREERLRAKGCVPDEDIPF